MSPAAFKVVPTKIHSHGCQLAAEPPRLQVPAPAADVPRVGIRRGPGAILTRRGASCQDVRLALCGFVSVEAHWVVWIGGFGFEPLPLFLIVGTWEAPPQPPNHQSNPPIKGTE